MNHNKLRSLQYVQAQSGENGRNGQWPCTVFNAKHNTIQIKMAISNQSALVSVGVKNHYYCTLLIKQDS